MNTNHHSSNSVTISRRYDQFDSTYPSAVLNGIISRDEYEQSISNINRGPRPRWIDTTFVIFPLCILTGVIITIYGSTHENRTSARFIVVIGIIITCVTACTCGILFQRMPSHIDWLKRAVITESKKYSRRTPISCTWELEKTYANGSSDLVIIIYINDNNVNNLHTNPVHSTVNIPLPTQTITPTPNQPLLNVSGEEESMVTPPPPYTAATNSTRPIFNYSEEVGSPPPPYSNTYETICSRCGTLRPYLTNNVCSLCVVSTDPLIDHNS